MKIGLGLYRESLTPDNFRFARQAGATHIVAHLTNYFSGRDPSLSSGNDFGEVLASKGFAQPGRIKTYEICNARYANEMLGADPRIAVCMPCSIAVIEQNGGVSVTAMRAGQAIHQFGEALGAKADLATQVDSEVQSIIEAALS